MEDIDIPAIRSGEILTRESAQKLIRSLEEKEVWVALSSICNNKAPGMDGFNAYFFKNAWKIIGKDVTATTREFFQKKYIYKAFNFALVTLIPKTANVGTIKDMSPISCLSLSTRLKS